MPARTQTFQFENWNLMDAVDSVLAFDRGAFDSASSGADLRQAVLSYLRQLDDEARRNVLAQYCRRFLTDEAIRAGYGVNDIINFVEWLSEIGVPVD